MKFIGIAFNFLAFMGFSLSVFAIFAKRAKWYDYPVVILTIVTSVLLLTSCNSQLGHVLTTAPTAPGQPVATVPAEALAGLAPAPAAYNPRQARAYYAAQLAATRAATPAKVKNSNNTTVENHVQNVTTWQLLLLASGALLVGVIFGAVTGFLLSQRVHVPKLLA